MNAPKFLAPPARETRGVADSLARLDVPSGTLCRVARWAESLDPDELAVLRRHIGPGRVRPIFDLLRADGHRLPYSATSWERHWTGRCTCTPGGGA